MTMKEYNITWENNYIEAKSPLDVAKKIRQDMIDDKCGWQFFVQDDETKEIFSVDLDEEDEDAVCPVKVYNSVIEPKT